MLQRVTAKLRAESQGAPLGETSQSAAEAPRRGGGRVLLGDDRAEPAGDWRENGFGDLGGLEYRPRAAQRAERVDDAMHDAWMLR
ncbi:hypothetical protein [Mycobacterium botniense]|uniref:Uncharacterized protein n=1 Tax=Mycobacterium botniense TaxID=84962 RepID=A0A7I9XXY0_9MYCO|nr:hypothetical protein [Mycobacterium botniense]GFG74652.1 hypothetical protein MBOT_20170 [Mycobacterium botniense]